MNKKVSIIILNWNGRDDTLECLSSVSKIDYPNYEVIVVDNGSTDGSVEAIRSKFPVMTVLENKENLGFAGGNNVGIRNALGKGSDFIFLLNNDTVVDGNVLNALVSAHTSLQTPGFLGCKILFYDRKEVIQHFGGRYVQGRLLKGVHISEGERDDGRFNEVQECEYVTGCAIFAERSVLTKIGLLDEGFFLYWEDGDWGLRAMAAGFKNYVVPEARVWHKVSASSGGSAVTAFYSARNRILFARKHGYGVHYFIWPYYLVRDVLKTRWDRRVSAAIYILLGHLYAAFGRGGRLSVFAERDLIGDVERKMRGALHGSRSRLKRFMKDSMPGRFFLLLLSLVLFPLVLLSRIIGRKKKGDYASILIFNYAGIGDTLMLTPAVAALKNHFPDARIDLAMCHNYVKDAFNGHPFFEEKIPFDFYWEGYKSFFHLKSRSEGVWKILVYHPKLYLKLAFRGYDIAIDFNLSEETRNISGPLAFALGIPIRIGYGEDRLVFFTDTVPFDVKKKHRVDLYHNALEPLGIKKESKRGAYVFPLAEQEKSWAREYLASRMAAGSFLLAMHPGGADLKVPRRWPVDYFVKAGRWVVDEAGGTVLLTGDKSDADVCNIVAAGLGEKCINSCGQVTLRQTASLLSRCDACLTNDTGTLHLAAAVGVPDIYAVFGPTDPALLTPPGANVTAFAPDMACASCAGSIIDKDTEACDTVPVGNCLNTITAEMVIEVLSRRIPCRA